MNRREYLRAAGSMGLVGLGAAGIRYERRLDERLRQLVGRTPPAGTDSPPGRDPPETDESRRNSTPTPPEPEPREGEALLGLFPGFGGERAPMEAYHEWLDRRSAVVVAFTDLFLEPAEIESLFDQQLTRIWDHGHVPLLILQPQYPGAEATPPDVERAIADGEHDATLRAWAAALRRWLVPERGVQRRLYLDLAPEMNGDWSPWGGEDDETAPADFVAMYRHVHRRLTGTGLLTGPGPTSDHLQWIWSPNVFYHGQRHPFAAYYPGDDYVDWFGVHGYNWGEGFEWSRWHTVEELYSRTLTDLRAIADKPVALTEIGSSSFVDGAYRPERKDEWIASLDAYVRERGIGMVCWFNLDKRTDWAVFGGARGTATFRHGGRQYPCYESYRTSFGDDHYLPARDSYARRLSTAEFQGRF